MEPNSDNTGMMEEMAEKSKRLDTLKRTLSTRLVMAGVFFGALLALVLSVIFSWSTGVSSPELSEEARAAFHSPPGSCLDWPATDAMDIRVTPCAQPHFVEIAGVVEIADKYPASAPFPDLTAWRDITQERCSEPTKTYLGKTLDPYGKLTVSALRPSDEDWSDGDRQVRCVLQWAGPGGKLQKITGPAAELNQSNVWEPGTCLAILGKTVGDPIDCAKPHSYEIVAELDLKEKFPSNYPTQADQKAWLDTRCNEVFRSYSDGNNPATQKLILTWDLREQESWDAGSTKVNCKVGAKLADGSGLASVTGSIKQLTPVPEVNGPAPSPGSIPKPSTVASTTQTPASVSISAGPPASTSSSAPSSTESSSSPPTEQQG